MSAHILMRYIQGDIDRKMCEKIEALLVEKPEYYDLLDEVEAFLLSHDKAETALEEIENRLSGRLHKLTVVEEPTVRKSIVRQPLYQIAVAIAIVCMVSVGIFWYLTEGVADDGIPHYAYSGTRLSRGDTLGDQRFSEAIDYYESYQYKDAILIFEELLQKMPEDPELNFYMGMSFLKIERYSTGVERLQMVIDHANNEWAIEQTPQLFQGYAYMELGDSQSAKSILLEVEKSGTPNNQKKATEMLSRIMD